MSHTRRTATLLRIAGTGSAALALGLGAAGTSFASGHGWNGHQAGFSSSHAQPATKGASGGDCSISTSDSLVPTASGTVQITVRTDGSGSCDVSLASYLTEGPDWAHSGTQTLVDVAHVTVHDGGSAQLSVKVPDVGCFGQIDLYKGSKVFSGDNAPHYPNGVFSGDSGLIKSWNGGTQLCSPTPSTPPSESAAPSDSASASASPSSSQSASSAPSDSASASASSSTGASASSSAGASSSASASTGASASSSTSAAAVASATSGSGTGLADTGSDGTGTIAGIAGALVVAGGAAVFVLRRRAAGSHS
ncbi:MULTISPECIES: hypothetical protein [Streptacidiphilus]|uniref:Gram-positive cocci surface proteins LPxTG domain-containing protein n=1 Tax=Streptacidiphilus cavernicola TaxID=3342716 RepID=A0ABV6UV48_9ACTN|nr:hypothetical protein [Streptacidiphilus jeojiense]